MKSWTIQKRIVILVAIMLAFPLGLAVFGSLALNDVLKRTRALVGDDVVGLRDSALASTAAAQAHVAMRRALTDKLPEARAASLAQMNEHLSEAEEALNDFEKLAVGRSDKDNLEAVLGSYRTFAERTRAVENSLAGLSQAQLQQEIESQVKPAYEAFMASMKQMFRRHADSGTAHGTSIISLSGRLRMIMSVTGIGSIFIGGLIGFLFIRDLGGVLKRLTGFLSETSEQLAGAAGQVSASSLNLADGASQQAASLEETSASLEEISSMVRQNASDANAAKELSTETRRAAEAGSSEVGAMTEAVDAIKASGDNISKIIRTIDEIAFQTNILALNAAVEAARAGDAGAGFAVVAEEVRALAQRSAEAAKETALNIEDSIQKSEDGVRISRQVAARFEAISAKTTEVDEVVGRIAVASSEQSQGLEQVNVATASMDSVTQSNAASAEETASAARQLDQHARQLNSAVGRLLSLAGNRIVKQQKAHKPAEREPTANLSHFRSMNTRPSWARA